MSSRRAAVLETLYRHTDVSIVSTGHYVVGRRGWKVSRVWWGTGLPPHQDIHVADDPVCQCVCVCVWSDTRRDPDIN